MVIFSHVDYGRGLNEADRHTSHKEFIYSSILSHLTKQLSYVLISPSAEYTESNATAERPNSPNLI